MSVYHKSESLLKEKKRLIDIILNSDEELSIQEFIDKYASDEYKKWSRRYDKQKEKDLKRGVIVD